MNMKIEFGNQKPTNFTLKKQLKFVPIKINKLLHMHCKLCGEEHHYNNCALFYCKICLNYHKPYACNHNKSNKSYVTQYTILKCKNNKILDLNWRKTKNNTIPSEENFNKYHWKKKCSNAINNGSLSYY